MSAFYFDTTYLGKMRWREVDSSPVIEQASKASVIACCEHGRAEFASICHRKFREGHASQQQAAAAFKQFQADCSYGAIKMLPLTEEIYTRVEKIFITSSEKLFLRAADALHLACAAANGFTEIYSNDRHLLASAPLFGLRGVNIIHHS